jgi:hypothetical protein
MVRKKAVHTFDFALAYAIAQAGAKSDMSPASTGGGSLGSVAGNTPGTGSWIGVGKGENV